MKKNPCCSSLGIITIFDQLKFNKNSGNSCENELGQVGVRCGLITKLRISKSGA